jgi:hypothetical protein
MVEIVLAIMLLVINMLTLHLLRMMYATSLLTSHHAICLGTHFNILNVLLTIFQARSFPLGQTAGTGTLLNTCLLIHFTLIDAGRVRLSKYRHRQQDAQGDEGLDVLHVFSPKCRADSLNAIKK